METQSKKSLSYFVKNDEKQQFQRLNLRRNIRAYTRTRGIFFALLVFTALYTTHAKGCAGRHIKGV